MIPPVEFPPLSTTSDNQFEEKCHTSEKAEQEVGSTENSIDVAENFTSKTIPKPIKSVPQKTSDNTEVTLSKTSKAKKTKENELLEMSDEAHQRSDRKSGLCDSEKVGLVIRKQKKKREMSVAESEVRSFKCVFWQILVQSCILFFLF